MPASLRPSKHPASAGSYPPGVLAATSWQNARAEAAQKRADRAPRTTAVGRNNRDEPIAAGGGLPHMDRTCPKRGRCVGKCRDEFVDSPSSLVGHEEIGGQTENRR